MCLAAEPLPAAAKGTLLRQGVAVDGKGRIYVGIVVQKDNKPKLRLFMRDKRKWIQLTGPGKTSPDLDLAAGDDRFLAALATDEEGRVHVVRATETGVQRLRQQKPEAALALLGDTEESVFPAATDIPFAVAVDPNDPSVVIGLHRDDTDGTAVLTAWISDGNLTHDETTNLVGEPAIARGAPPNRKLPSSDDRIFFAGRTGNSAECQLAFVRMDGETAVPFPAVACGASPPSIRFSNDGVHILVPDANPEGRDLVLYQPGTNMLSRRVVIATNKQVRSPQLVTSGSLRAVWVDQGGVEIGDLESSPPKVEPLTQRDLTQRDFEPAWTTATSFQAFVGPDGIPRLIQAVEGESGQIYLVF